MGTTKVTYKHSLIPQSLAGKEIWNAEISHVFAIKIYFLTLLAIVTKPLAEDTGHNLHIKGI